MRRRRRLLLPFILLPTALGAATLVWSGSGAWKQNHLQFASEMETGWSMRAMHDMPRAHAAGEAAVDQEDLLLGFDSGGQCHRPRAYAVRPDGHSGHPLMITAADADENAAAAKLANTHQPALDARNGRPGARWGSPMQLARLGGLAGGGIAGGATGRGDSSHEPPGHEPPGHEPPSHESPGDASDGSGEQDAGADSDADTESNDGDAAGPGAGLGEDDHGHDNNSSEGGDDDESYVPSNPKWTYDPEGPHVQVPEPGTLGLLMLGLLGCMIRQRTA